MGGDLHSSQLSKSCEMSKISSAFQWRDLVYNRLLTASSQISSQNSHSEYGVIITLAGHDEQVRFSYKYELSGQMLIIPKRNKTVQIQQLIHRNIIPELKPQQGVESIKIPFVNFNLWDNFIGFAKLWARLLESH